MENVIFETHFTTITRELLGVIISALPTKALLSRKAARQRERRSSVEIVQSIMNRHSTRSFDPAYCITRNDQIKILEAGLHAPSPKNRQPWKLIVFDSKEELKGISRTMIAAISQLMNYRIAQGCDYSDLRMAIDSANLIGDVSMLVLICYLRDPSNDHGEKMGWQLTAQAFEVADLQSIGACVENMLIQAESMGIDSLWICDVLYAEKEISEEFNIKNPFVAAVAFGKAGRYSTPRKSLHEKVEWYNERQQG